MSGAGASTRRRLLAGGIRAGIGGSFIARAIAPAAAIAAGAASEPELLDHLLETELLEVFCYQHVLGTGLLAAGPGATVRGLLAQEQVHLATLLRAAGTGLGTGGAVGPASVAAADRQLAAHRVSDQLAGLKHQHDCLRLLLSLEGVAAGAYYAASSKLGDAGLVRSAVEILCNEAQHSTIVSRLIKPRDFGQAVPYPFVTGTP